MFKKIVAVTLSLAMSAALFAGCGAQKGNDKAQTDTSTSSAASTTAVDDQKEIKKDPVTLTLWHSWPEDTVADSMHGYITKFAEKYQKDNPYVTLKVSGNVSGDKLLTAVSSGQGPDIFTNAWNNCASWSDKGAVMDLTDLANNDATFDRNDFIKGAIERGIYKGKLYGIPFQVYSSEIYYNKELLAKEGYTKPPETIEELVEMAIKLTKFDSKGNIIQAGFIPDFPWLDNCLWPVAFGAKWIDPATNKLTFDSPEMAAAYQWQVDLYSKLGFEKLMRFKSGLGKLTGAQDPFISGKLAMQFSGEWIFGTMAQYAPKMDYGVAPIPYPKDNPGVKGAMFVTTNVWNINARTKVDKNEVWKALSALTSKESYKEFGKGINGAGQMMARATALDSMPETADPKLKEVGQMLKNPNCDGFPMLTYVNEYLTAISDNMQLTLNGKQTVAEAQKKVMETVQPIADKNPIN